MAKAAQERNAQAYKKAPQGTMKVECWCGRSTVNIPVELVGTTTESCGRDGCEP